MGAPPEARLQSRSAILNATTTQITSSEFTLLTAAKAGDESAFAQLTVPLQRELHIHCYRMLGLLHEADDALQETMLRAWRQIARFEPRAPFRAWLYRIATNVCLTMLERRTRRGEVSLTMLDANRDAGRQDGRPLLLQPYPDSARPIADSMLLNPELRAERDENIELAFVAAVQTLPARQRATLLLRDVIGYSAAEVAEMLQASVAAVNSALQRARATLIQERETGNVARVHHSSGATAEAALVQRLVEAWQTADVPAIVAILTEDALLAMPPEPEHYLGGDAISTFLTTGRIHDRLHHFRFLHTRANGQPALATYLRDEEGGPFIAYGLLVLACADGKIASLTRFPEPELVSRCGFPLIYEE